MSAIESAKKAIKGRDAAALADAVTALIAEAPEEWERLLFLHATPDANISSFAPAFNTLVEAARLVLERSLPEASIVGLVRHLARVAYFHQQFQKTDEVFYATAAWNERDTVRIWRTCAILQSQNRLLGKRVSEHATKSGVFDGVAANAGFLKHGVTGSTMDPVSQSDTRTEVAEIIIRATLHASKPSGAPTPAELKSPYEDADFANFQTMAARYLFLCEAWQRVKFKGWLAVYESVRDTEGQQQQIVEVVPPDEDVFLRQHVSYRRENIFQTQEFLPLLIADKDSFTDTPGRIQQLAQSLKHPALAQSWDGAHNTRVFRNAVEYTTFLRTVEQYVDFHHYGAWIDELRSARRAKGISEWDDYLKVRNALNVLGQGFELAADRLQNVDGDGSLRQVIRVHAATLARAIAGACRIDVEITRSIIDELTFDARRRGDAEWWDMPLVPLGDDDLLFVPNVAVVGNPIRTVEHMVAAFTNQDSIRSRSFEKAATEHLQDLAECRVERSIKFDASDGKLVEYDVIAFWKNYLLLVELKCLRSVTSPYEEFRAGKEIEKAISQLERRRNLVRADWTQLKRTAPRLCLPDSPIPPNRIICVAVSNLMAFTGLVERDVYVADHFCFRRFFSDDPRIMGTDYSLGGAHWVQYGRIRKLDKPSPEELIEYLKDPPQVRWIREQLRLQWAWLYPPLELRPMRQLSTHFAGERPKLGRPVYAL